MSSTEREPLCTVDWCARPSDPDWHLCVVCGALATEHAHVQSRAQAPDRKLDKANQVMLCVPHHREVDERQGGTHSHHIRELPGRGRVYFRLDLRGETLFEKALSERWVVNDLVRENNSKYVEALSVAAREIGPSVRSALACLYLDSDGVAIGVGYQISRTGRADRSKYVVAARYEIDRHPEFTEGTYGGSGKPSPMPDGVYWVPLIVTLPTTRDAASPVEAGTGGEQSLTHYTSPFHTEVSVDPSTQPVNTTRWRALDLVDRPDSQLAWEFEHFYAASGMLKLEAYRRVEAYRLKYAGVAAESWVQKAETDFDLKESTLHQYSRAWQAFEQAVDQADLPEELADSFRMMGGGVWQVIGRQPEETWLQMSEIALNVVAEGGVSRGLPARVAAKGQEEGLVKKANVSLKCPSCGNVAPKGEYEKVK